MSGINLFWLINKVRYYKPIETALDTAPVTIALAAITMLIDSFFELFTSDFHLWVVLGAAIIVDLITGVVSNKIRKNPVTSLGARQTIIKTIEYIVFLGLLVMVSNAAEKYTLEENSWLLQQIATIVKEADVLGFLIAIWIEIISISENMVDKNGVIKTIIEKIKQIIKKRLDE